jgi:serine/threonine protein kinase
MQASENMPVKPGEVLAGKYRIERVLGAGGMGVVVEALHIDLDERVALKFLLPEALKPELVERFLREARTAIRIKNEHVARVSDVGRLEGGAPYMVMEFLVGSDLDAILKARGSLPPGQVVDWILQACEALAEAHSLGIIHRDLKPANLFLTHRADGTELIKVIDFGIAKAIQPEGSSAALTHTSQIMGSPLYMSPEQMRNAKHVDARSDIWALGITLYQLLSNKTPFDADTVHALCAALLTEAPKPLETQQTGLPPALCAVVMRCLAKDPEERYASVAQLATALRPFGSPSAAASMTRISAFGPPAEGLSTHHALARSQPSLQPPAPKKYPWVILAGALLAVGAGVLLFPRAAPSDTSASQGLSAKVSPETSGAPAASSQATTVLPIPPVVLVVPVASPPSASTQASPANTTSPGNHPRPAPHPTPPKHDNTTDTRH